VRENGLPAESGEFIDRIYGKGPAGETSHLYVFVSTADTALVPATVSANKSGERDAIVRRKRSLKIRRSLLESHLPA
jgi:hypothetical protein